MPMLYGMVVKKAFDTYKTDGSGDIEKTYINVFKQPMKTEKSATFTDWKTAQEQGGDIILIEITEADYNSYVGDPTTLWIDGRADMPKWQYNETLDEKGHWDDPTDDTSTWYVDDPVPDNRYRIIIRHNTDLTAPDGASTFHDEIKVDQNDKTAGGDPDRVTLRFEVRNVGGTLVGNGRQEFYNANTPTVINLTNGVGELFVDTSKAHGKMAFRSNHSYRIDNTQRAVFIIVFSKIVND